MESDDAIGTLGVARESIADAAEDFQMEVVGKRSVTKGMKTSPIWSFESDDDEQGKGSVSDEFEGGEDDELEDDVEDLEDEVSENKFMGEEDDSRCLIGSCLRFGREVGEPGTHQKNGHQHQG